MLRGGAGRLAHVGQALGHQLGDHGRRGAHLRGGHLFHLGQQLRRHGHAQALGGNTVRHTLTRGGLYGGGRACHGYN